MEGWLYRKREGTETREGKGRKHENKQERRTQEENEKQAWRVQGSSVEVRQLREGRLWKYKEGLNRRASDGVKEVVVVTWWKEGVKFVIREAKCAEIREATAGRVKSSKELRKKEEIQSGIRRWKKGRARRTRNGKKSGWKDEEEYWDEIREKMRPREEEIQTLIRRWKNGRSRRTRNGREKCMTKVRKNTEVIKGGIK